MIILGLDPGTTHTGCVWFDGTRVVRSEHLENAGVVVAVSLLEIPLRIDAVACEMLVYQGETRRPGEETFETAYWIGRFMGRCGVTWHRIKPYEWKVHVCGRATAGDSERRTALIRRFGGKAAAIGRKKAPGPLYGVTGHCWSALAVAVTAWDRHYAKGRIA